MKVGGKRATKVVVILVLVLLALVALAPVALVLINSFKSHREIIQNPLALPTKFSFDYYLKTWKFAQFGEGFANSLKMTGTAIVTGVIGASTMGYVLAGKKVKTWKALTVYFMLCTTVPIQLFLLPLYSGFAQLNLMGNPFAVGVVVAAWNLPLPIFLMRTYYLKVPFELEEAAAIDGANTFQVFTRVMLPIVSPGIVTVSTIVGLFAWNEYLLSRTLLQGDKNFTATLKFLSLNGTFTKDLTVIMCGAVIMVIPIILIFILLQKQFVEGMASGAVKG